MRRRARVRCGEFPEIDAVFLINRATIVQKIENEENRGDFAKCFFCPGAKITLNRNGLAESLFTQVRPRCYFKLAKRFMWSVNT